MTLLVNEDIYRMLSLPDLDQRLIITPLLDRAKQIGPGSVDLRLGTEFIESGSRRGAATDPVRGGAVFGTEELPQSYQVPLGADVVLHPGQFILASSLEFVRLPADVGGQILSRSSWGRVGLTVATSAAVQPGYTGMITFQLANSGAMPIVLHPGLRIVQMVLWYSRERTKHAYGAQKSQKYVRDLGPVESKVSSEDPELRRLIEIGGKLGVPKLLPPTTRRAGED